MTHVKLFEQFIKINEAFKVNRQGSDLEEAGVEVPNFRIDLTNLREQRTAIVKTFKENNSLRNKLKADPSFSIDKKKIENDLADMIKIFNTGSKKAYQEFEKVLKSVKFPDDAKYTVEFKEYPEGEVFHSSDHAFIDIDEKSPVKLFEVYIKPNYVFMSPRKRTEQSFRQTFSWSEVIAGQVNIGVRSWFFVPTILDKEFILNEFLNPKNG